MKISAEKKSAFLFIFLLAAPVFAANISCMAADSCAGVACHANLRGGQKTHPPAVFCLDCHQGVSPAHVEIGQKIDQEALVICLECHDDIIVHQHLHPPVAQRDCHICHNPHGDFKNMLLPKGYSPKLFLSYGDDEYSLCFSCHQRDLLLFPDTSFATGFRDNQRNLHYLHVNKASRGRNCKLCHDPHGSKQPKLIAETVDFGKWPMKLNFVKTESGGSCMPGCHKQEEYSIELNGAVKMETENDR